MTTATMCETCEQKVTVGGLKHLRAGDRVGRCPECGQEKPADSPTKRRRVPPKVAAKKRKR